MKPTLNFDALFTAIALTLVVSLLMSIERFPFFTASSAPTQSSTAIAALTHAVREALLGQSNS